MDDSCAVCADSLEWVAYGSCGHREMCSTCVVCLRVVLEDKRCCICKTESPTVFVTKDASVYDKIIAMARCKSTAVKQLAVQLIPICFDLFPSLARKAIRAQMSLVSADEISIRVKAIRGLLQMSEKTEFIAEVTYCLAGRLSCGTSNEQEEIHMALMSLLWQNIKASFKGLLKHVETGMFDMREQVILFMKDKVFPFRFELLKPEGEIERYLTDLFTRTLYNVTAAELKLLLELLTSFSIFGDGAHPDHIQVLVKILEDQGRVHSHFYVADEDQIDKVIVCMNNAEKFFKNGVSGTNFLIHVSDRIIPVIDKISEERKIQLLKAVTGFLEFAQARHLVKLIPKIVEISKVPNSKKDGIQKPLGSSDNCASTFYRKVSSSEDEADSVDDMSLEGDAMDIDDVICSLRNNGDDAQEIPKELDWRNKLVKGIPVLSLIQNQGLFPSCWACTACGVTEDVHRISFLEDIQQLSPQDLINCVLPSTVESHETGCFEYYLDKTFDHMIKHGVRFQKDCIYRGYRFDRDPWRHHILWRHLLGNGVPPQVGSYRIRGYVQLDHWDEASLQKALLKHPITVGIYMSCKTMLEFQNIRDFEGCDSPVVPLSDEHGHYLIFVGWGSNPNGQKYWIVMNSFGVTWGSEGFGKLARGTINKNFVIAEAWCVII